MSSPSFQENKLMPPPPPTTTTTADELSQPPLDFDSFDAKKNEKKISYSVQRTYGDNSRNDRVEITKFDKKVVKLGRWTTFKSFHFPEGAIVTGFRGRRDYKDGNCQGIMCCGWCSEENAFKPFIFTISNGYNGTFSEKDFETVELVDQSEFTFYNSDAVKNIKDELR
jgi:hypothetical protein